MSTTSPFRLACAAFCSRKKTDLTDGEQALQRAERSRCAACMSCTCLILTSGACRGAAAVGTLQQIWEALTHSRPQGAASETQQQANEAATSTFWHALFCKWAPR